MSRQDDLDKEIKDLEDSVLSKKEQKKATQRRLDIIKVQIANVGRPYAPPERLTEEEDLENEIAQLTIQIGQLQSELTALKKKRADLGVGVREMPSSAMPIEPRLKRHKPGDYIDRYQIKELIDIENIDSVYRAYDTHNRYDVAIKQFNTGKRSSLKDFESKRDDFEREARFMREMEHPNIVGVRHVFPANGTSYIVMHYLPSSLDEKLSQPGLENGMDYDQAKQIFEQICEGLYYSYKIFKRIHGHINPGNILLDKSDQPRINNFGVPFTKPNLAFIPYLTPEQIRGEHIRPETDVYALGVLFYSMLTGKKYDPTENLAKNLKRKDIPKGVVSIIRTALSKEPTDRYANAGDLLKAVNRLQIGGRRPIGNIPLMIGGGLILLLLMGGWGWLNSRLTPPNMPTPTVTQAVVENITPTPTDTLTPTELPIFPPDATLPVSTTTTPTSISIPASTSTVLTVTPTIIPPSSSLASSTATVASIPIDSGASYSTDAEETLAQIIREGKIIVGVRYDAPPYGRHQSWPAERCDPTIYDQEFNPQGYDILIARKLAERWLGDENKVEFRCVPVAKRGEVVSSGSDVRLGIFSFSKLNRCIDPPDIPLDPKDMRVWCSESYMLDGQGLLTYVGSEIDNLCDVRGKEVAALKGTTAENSFAEVAELFCGLPAPTVNSDIDSREVIINQLLSRNILAYATNVEILNAYAFEQQGNLKVVQGKFGPAEEFGIAVTPGEVGLLELINEAISEWKEDGTLEDLMKKTGLKCLGSYSKLCGLKPITDAIPSYVIQPGDTLGGIAIDMWGQYEFWPCIVKANPNILSIDNPVINDGGTIMIPAKPATVADCGS